jgi:hypothetical protein
MADKVWVTSSGKNNDQMSYLLRAKGICNRVGEEK